ncbi:hypothetical protein GLYMA_09G281250v4 [Glycine max]|nr:hypothetical protein GLYMA_09G281250v4 [Glycine max]KAH1045217.1 hypothetical protein GYH30_026426 [Glycine max]
MQMQCHHILLSSSLACWNLYVANYSACKWSGNIEFDLLQFSAVSSLKRTCIITLL